MVSPAPLFFDAEGAHATTNAMGVALFRHLLLVGEPGKNYEMQFRSHGLLSAVAKEKLQALPCPGKTTFSLESELCECGPGNEPVWPEGSLGFVTEPGDCNACANGTYHVGVSSSPCVACPPNMTTAGPGADSPDLCYDPTRPTSEPTAALPPTPRPQSPTLEPQGPTGEPTASPTKPPSGSEVSAALRARLTAVGTLLVPAALFSFFA